MSLIFITGASGSGKTSVTREMVRSGFSAYDTDDPNHTGIAGWYNKSTDEYLAGFNEVKVTNELLETYVWRLSSEALNTFIRRSKLEQIYLCGRLRDASKIIEAAHHLIFLTVSGETIRTRLEQRAQIPGEVEWGREPGQIERSIEVNKEIENEYRKLGAVMINADQPLANVVEDIIHVTA